MPFTLQNVDANQSISAAPAVMNANFDLIESTMQSVESILSTSAKTIKLTSLTSLAANSMEAAGISLTKNAGDVISILPDGGSATFKVDTNGDVTARKITSTGTDVADSSVMNRLQVKTDLKVLADSGVATVTLDGQLDLGETNSSIVLKNSTFAISDSNTGSAAAAPLDLSKTIVGLLDYDNSGSALANSGEVKIDLAALTTGQYLKLICTRNNASGMKFYNGTNGDEIFAVIDVTGSGLQSLANTVKPAFTDVLDNDNPPSVDLQVIEISPGNKRLLILKSSNFTAA